jgi:1-pyrroline-5-carboxylate dehydrogenase
MEWDHRAAIFMRAADILEGPARAKNMAVIMACHSKTPYEAELDLEEMADFWRLGARYLQFIFDQQPDQAPGELNRLDWRPLEGFVLAVTPFNFYSIGGNLASAPAMAGNVVLWKPSTAVGLSGLAVMEVLEQAGLPAGVINFVPFASRDADLVLGHRDLAGVHFTGSFETLAGISKTVWTAPEQYRSIPRIVGETGGKGFLVAHASADPRAVATAIIRGGFEYQGQKCSALSRAYIPKSLWPQICGILREELPRLSFGDVARSHNFMGALISEEAFGKVTGYIELAKASGDEMVYDGGRHPGKGWFVGPTVIKVTDPHSRLMQEEIFGPVVTVFVYQDGDFKQTLALVDRTSPFALTGSVFARDRGAIRTAETALRFSAGNFYINDKPTGAVVGRQPFGGARHSGTNDKAGYWTNLLRWLSPRAIKETTAPLEGWRRPYMMK